MKIDSLDVIMLATPELEYYARYSKQLWQKYCDAKQYKFQSYSEILVPDMHVNWSKIEMVRRHLASSNADWVVMVDADTYVCNPQRSMNDLLEPFAQKEIVFSLDCRRLGALPLPLNLTATLKHRTFMLPNAGFVAIRNNSFASDFFDSWLSLAKGELSHLANIHPRNQRVLWQGLYFQNLSEVGLFGHQIQRVYSKDAIEKARRNRADFIHVKSGLAEKDIMPLFDEL